MDNKINKSGQITIFIILAILFVAGIIIFFLLWGGSKTLINEQEDVKLVIENCIKDAAAPSIEKVLSGGGKVNPAPYINYQDEKYNYLCYQKNFYLTCINQIPMLKSFAESEIKKDSEERVRMCFDSLINDLKQRNFEVSDGTLDWSIELLPGGIEININKQLEINKGESKQNFNKFKINIISPLYDLIMLAREIVNQESQYCNFEYNGYMLLYPEYDIKRIDYDNSKIYKLTDRRSGKLFKFAVRSCAFAPGY